MNVNHVLFVQTLEQDTKYGIPFEFETSETVFFLFPWHFSYSDYFVNFKSFQLLVYKMGVNELTGRYKVKRDARF